MSAWDDTTQAAVQEFANLTAEVSAIIAEASQVPGAGFAVSAVKFIYKTVQDAGELKVCLSMVVHVM